MKNYFSIENQFELDNETGLMVIELFDCNDGNYEYYLFMPGYTLIHAFGVPDSERYDNNDFTRLYENGYFDDIIETEFQ